jgi:hypothetical protein
MSVRLQVLLDETEFAEIREVARQERMTVAAWVRRALREARREDPRRSQALKFAALSEAVQHEFPAPDIDEMLAEIERGYGSGDEV